MSNPSGMLSAYVFPGSWDGIDPVPAIVYLRGVLAIAVDAQDLVVTGRVRLSGPWVRVDHDGGTVFVPFDQVASIVELPVSD